MNDDKMMIEITWELIAVKKASVITSELVLA